MDDYGDPSTAKADRRWGDWDPLGRESAFAKGELGFYIHGVDAAMESWPESLKHPACDEPRVATALDHQVGGDHYKHFKIQPAEFVEKNNLGFMLGNCVKYCCRYVEKGNPLDLEKAIHYIQMKMELERGGGT